jgi:site-specific DNA recombinase
LTAEALRSLIERVVLTPDATASDGLAAELRGDPAEILALAAAPEAGTRRRVGAKNSPERLLVGSQLSVVAGARNHLYRTRFLARSRR